MSSLLVAYRFTSESAYWRACHELAESGLLRTWDEFPMACEIQVVASRATRQAIEAMASFAGLTATAPVSGVSYRDGHLVEEVLA